MLQLWSCLCAHQVGWASVGSGSPREPGPALLAAVSWWLPVADTVFPCSAAQGRSEGCAGTWPGCSCHHVCQLPRELPHAAAAWALHGGCSGCLGTPKSLGLKIDWIFPPLSALISHDHFRPMSSGPYILLTQQVLSGTLSVSIHAGASYSEYS